MMYGTEGQRAAIDSAAANELRDVLGGLWSVWVGGCEVNDYGLDHAAAVGLADSYSAQGYGDVALDLIGGEL